MTAWVKCSVILIEKMNKLMNDLQYFKTAKCQNSIFSTHTHTTDVKNVALLSNKQSP